MVRRFGILAAFISLLLLFPAFSAEGDRNLEQEMDDYTRSARIRWPENPFRDFETDRYFNPWNDYDSYNSSFWMGSILNMDELYDEDRFKLDSVSFYHAPRLGTELTLFGVESDGSIGRGHRLNLGLGFFVDFTFLSYKKGTDQLYGRSFLFSTFMQVEPFFDYIYKDKFRLRISPCKHICYHMGGDILGDPSLYDRSVEEFRDAGFEQVHVAAAYRWGWFTFHGGISAAYSGYRKANIVNVLNMNAGIEFRFPLWGAVNLLAGFVAGTNLDLINTISRPAAGTGYTPTASSWEWTPVVSVGLGIEIYRMVFGGRYELQRSRQMYSYRQVEQRLGFSATLFL